MLIPSVEQLVFPLHAFGATQGAVGSARLKLVAIMGVDSKKIVEIRHVDVDDEWRVFTDILQCSLHVAQCEPAGG